MDRGARGWSWPVSGSCGRGWFVVAKEHGTSEREKKAARRTANRMGCKMKG